jgi:hypothetical protein
MAPKAERRVPRSLNRYQFGVAAGAGDAVQAVAGADTGELVSYSGRIASMAMVKRSVTLDEELVNEALAFAGARGLSAVLNEGLRRQVLVERARRLVERFEAEHGPIPDDDLAAVDAQWPR